MWVEKHCQQREHKDLRKKRLDWMENQQEGQTG